MNNRGLIWLAALMLLTVVGCSVARGSRGPAYPAHETYGEDDYSSRRRSALPADTPFKAGEVDDNDSFSEYVRYFQAYPDRDVKKVDVTDRMILQIEDREGKSLPFAHVRVRNPKGRDFLGTADAAGQVMFPAAAIGFRDQCHRFDAEVNGEGIEFHRGPHPVLQVQSDPYGIDEVRIDIGFCLDTTGSMGDEISRMRETLQRVAAQIDKMHHRVDLRWGMVAYRDRGDKYVTRTHSFTRHLPSFQRTLERTQARGGGDDPESVNEALHVAVNRLEWRRGDAIRLLFLIGDAPPHLDYRDDILYTRSMRKAVERGIKINTIGASGLNDTGEFVWRQLAQFTLGRFMFISYGGGTTHHVGRYEENNLDALMVQSVEREVRALRLPQGRSRPTEEPHGHGRDPEDFAPHHDGYREWDGR